VTVTAKAEPGGDAGPAPAYTVPWGVYEVALALTGLLRKTAKHAAGAADRQAADAGSCWPGRLPQHTR
jgi:hypothetical protein